MARTEGNRALEIGLQEGTPLGPFGHPTPPGKCDLILSRIAHATALAEERKQSGALSTPKPPCASWVSSPRINPSVNSNSRTQVARSSDSASLEKCASSKDFQAPITHGVAAGITTIEHSKNNNHKGNGLGAVKGKVPKSIQSIHSSAINASKNSDGISSLTSFTMLASPIPSKIKETVPLPSESIPFTTLQTDAFQTSHSVSSNSSTVSTFIPKSSQTTNSMNHSSTKFSSTLPSMSQKEVKTENQDESRSFDFNQTSPMNQINQKGNTANHSSPHQPLPKSSFSSVPFPKSIQRSDKSTFITEKPSTFKSLNTLSNSVHQINRAKSTMDESNISLIKHSSTDYPLQTNQTSIKHSIHASPESTTSNHGIKKSSYGNTGSKRIGRPPGSTSANKHNSTHSSSPSLYSFANSPSSSLRRRRPALTEKDVNLLLSRYGEDVILTLLREIARSVGTRLDWEGIRRRALPNLKCIREVQAIWRFMAYHSSLLDPESLSEDDLALDDESDLEDDMDFPLGVNGDVLSEVSSYVKADMQKFGISLNVGSSSFRKKGENKTSKSKPTAVNLLSSSTSSTSASLSISKTKSKSPLKSQSASGSISSLNACNAIPSTQTTSIGLITSTNDIHQHTNDQFSFSPTTSPFPSFSSFPSVHSSQANKPSPSISSNSMHALHTHQDTNQSFSTSAFSTSASLPPSPNPGLSNSASFPSSHSSSMNASVTFSTFPSTSPSPSSPSPFSSIPEFPIIQQRRKRKLWSIEEDKALMAAIEQYGEGQWGRIVKADFGFQRTPSQIAQRWALLRRRQDKENGIINQYYKFPSPSPSSLSSSPSPSPSLPSSPFDPSKDFNIFPSSDSVNHGYSSSYVYQNSNSLTSQESSDPQVKIESSQLQLDQSIKLNMPAQQSQQNPTQDMRSYTENPPSYPILPHPALKSGVLRKGKSTVYSSATSAPRLRPPVASPLGKNQISNPNPNSTIESNSNAYLNPIQMQTLSRTNAPGLGPTSSSLPQPRLPIQNQRLNTNTYMQGKFIAPGAKIIGTKPNHSGSGNMDIWNNPNHPSSGVNNQVTSVRGRVGIGSGVHTGGPDPAVQAAAVAAGARIAPASEAVSFFKTNKSVPSVYTSNVSTSSLSAGMSGSSTWYGPNQGEGTIVHYICTGIGGNSSRIVKGRGNDTVPNSKPTVSLGSTSGLPSLSGKDAVKDPVSGNAGKEKTTEIFSSKPINSTASSSSPLPFPPVPPTVTISANSPATTSTIALNPAPVLVPTVTPSPVCAPVPAPVISPAAKPVATPVPMSVSAPTSTPITSSASDLKPALVAASAPAAVATARAPVATSAPAPVATSAPAPVTIALVTPPAPVAATASAPVATSAPVPSSVTVSKPLPTPALASLASIGPSLFKPSMIEKASVSSSNTLHVTSTSMEIKSSAAKQDGTAVTEKSMEKVDAITYEKPSINKNTIASPYQITNIKPSPNPISQVCASNHSLINDERSSIPASKMAMDASNGGNSSNVSEKR